VQKQKNGNAKFEATTRVEAGAEAKAGTSTKLIGDTTADVEVHASAKNLFRSRCVRTNW
jgi:hypothetical protein